MLEWGGKDWADGGNWGLEVGRRTGSAAQWWVAKNSLVSEFHTGSPPKRKRKQKREKGDKSCYSTSKEKSLF